MANGARIAAAICLCCSWMGFYNFLTSSIRAWEVIYDKFVALKGKIISIFP